MVDSLIKILSTNDLNEFLVTTNNNIVNKKEFKDMNFFSKIVCQFNLGRVNKDKVFSKLAEQARDISYYADAGKFNFKIGDEVFVIDKDNKIEGLDKIVKNLTFLRDKVKLSDKQPVTYLLERIDTIFMQINMDSQIIDTAAQIAEGNRDEEIDASINVPHMSHPFIKDKIASRKAEIQILKREIQSASNWKRLLEIYSGEKTTPFFKNLICQEFTTTLKEIDISTKGHLDLYKDLDQFVTSEKFSALPEEITELAEKKLEKLKNKVPKPVNIGDLPKVAEFLNVAKYPSYMRDLAEKNIIFYIERSIFNSSNLDEIIRNDNNQFNQNIIDAAIERKRSLIFEIDIKLNEIHPMVIEVQLEIEGHKAKANLLY